MAARNPTKKGVSDIKSALLKPALTSHFEVQIKPPSGSESFFRDNQAPHPSDDILTLLCSDATLPGSSFATHESNNDFHGTTERFAYRRNYDDRIDLSFYVDSENYYTIRFFETWMKYVCYESISGYTNGRPGMKQEEYFYRFNYPEGSSGYRKDSFLSVVKFERNYKQKLVYEFTKSYPISIQSMPVSYDTSSLLKCTVSMSYVRYVVIPNGPYPNPLKESEPGQSTANGVPNNPFELTPERQAELNSVTFSQNLNLGNYSPGTFTNTNFDDSRDPTTIFRDQQIDSILSQNTFR